ncbi:MAG TPA: VWA domain-containing protein [Pyrinomonadaceae bacterium]|nr:VWA domain-containing protein [Pyrinomonadaceae bacterium]
MRNIISLALALSLSPAAALSQSGTPAQRQQQQQSVAPSPTPTPTPQVDDDDVVRITSNLVQFDAVVLDKKGQQVTDLRPEDFEVLVDGKQQTITNFSYVSTGMPTTGGARAGAPPADKTLPPAPSAPLKAEQVRRTIALVVDDLGTSFESMHFVRSALRKFVDEQMQPGDLVAIMRTSAGVGALQQFTSDKRMLYAAIERVRWYPRGRAGVAAFAALEGDSPSVTRDPTMGAGGDDNSMGRASPADEIDEFREEIFSVGTLGALNYIVRGLKDLPGRKSVVLFSDGFQIFRSDGTSGRVMEVLRRLVDLANRASVVVYTMDARGLPTLGLTAADSTAGMTPMQISQALMSRSSTFFNSKTGLNYLAQETGGFFIHNNNDLSGGLRKVLDDQRGYYLIGFRPDESIFDPARTRVRFNHLEVKVKRPGLKVRTRGGFYGFTEEEAVPVRRTRREQILAALTSPFIRGEVPVRLTSLFTSDADPEATAKSRKPAYMSQVSTMMHIDVNDFKFTEEPDGWRKMVMDVVAVTFGDNGVVVDSLNRTETVRVRGEMYDFLRRNGLVYVVKVPVKKPGAYQLRVAVRDAETEKVGSASQFIEVPDLKKDRLALSGIVMMGTSPAGAQGQQQAPQQQGAAAEGPSGGADPLSGPAVRRMRGGIPIEYYFDIYNAKLDRATGKPQLQTQTRLFRDGKPVFTGSVNAYDPGSQTDMRRLHAGSRLQLGKDFPAGEYVLQVIVTDTLAKGKHRMATQWIDFELVK